MCQDCKIRTVHGKTAAKAKILHKQNQLILCGKAEMVQPGWGTRRGWEAKLGRPVGQSPWATGSSPGQTRPEPQGEARSDQCPGMTAGGFRTRGEGGKLERSWHDSVGN